MNVPPDEVEKTDVWPRALALVIVFLVIVGGGFGSLAGKLTDQEKNTNASFLPANAEATKALNASKAFLPAEDTPTVVLYERDSGVTPADEQRALADLTAVRKHADWLDGQPTPPVKSRDGKALQLTLPFDGKDNKVFIQNVKDLRQLLDAPGRPAGLKVYVTGLGGISSDLFEVFGSINGTLLLVTGVIVILILLVVYRSPVLWVLPVLGAGLAFTMASGILYLLAKTGTLEVNGQSDGILPVLTFGAATDYALLLIARYREELHRHGSTWDAMKVAWRAALPAILASAATVMLALLCLLFSELNSNKSLGPVGALGVACSAFVMLVFLPGGLLLGRWLFWPRIPHLDGEDPVHEGIWSRLADRLDSHSALFGAGTVVILLVLAIGATGLKSGGLPQDKALTSRPQSVIGLEHQAKHFPAGSGTPVQLIVPTAAVGKATEILGADKDVASVFPFTDGVSTAPLVRGGDVLLVATLAVDANSNEALDVVKRIRSEIDGASKAVLVGGFPAIRLDIHESSKRDNRLIIPIVLLLILIVLAILLRALVAPLVLIVTVILSYAATLGTCAFFFTHVFGFAGSDASFPLFAFVFLVALGVDYNIFLISRVREEVPKHGTHDGMLRGLTVTGGVITSAGVVLAATFAALGTLPLVFLAEIGFAVSFGVILDTFVVRSLLVPAIVLKLGDRMWWPSALARGGAPAEPSP
ncbi:MAG: MmpL protein [Frankiales bacterium]|nr:MmpL protein [Frankiales bacterium]